MKTITSALSAVVGIGLAAIAVPAFAATVFFEDFEGYTAFPDQIPQSSGIYGNNGIPKISEGAKEIWYGGRFQTQSNGFVNSDLFVQQNGLGSNTSHVGRVEDDAGLVFKLNTTGLDAITLSFDWRTYLPKSTDKFVVGYHVGSLSQFGTCTGEGETGCFAQNSTTGLPTLPAWYTAEDGSAVLTGNWTQLLRDAVSDSWSSAAYLLPDSVENQTEVWFAFWLDNGEGDYALLDNVTVTATMVAPVPPAVWLFGTGLLGLVGIARRRRV